MFGRVHGMCDLLYGVPHWQSGEKKHDFFMVFRGNIVTGITRNTFSDKVMLLGTFLMKNIFIDFPTHILKHIFCYIQLKNPCFLEANLIVICEICEYIKIVEIKPMKSLDFLMKLCKKYASEYELENR